MKKIAFFVEGPTEAYFVERFLKEIISQRKFTIKQFLGKGGKAVPRMFILYSEDQSTSMEYVAHIYISQTDNRVNSDMLDQMDSLRKNGFELIVALKDLRGEHQGRTITLSDLPHFEAAEKKVFKKFPCIKSIIAVMEIETWFIGETNHYANISPCLTSTLIQNNSDSIGCDPYTCDLIQIVEPAETLNKIYHLCSMGYSKDKSHRERTINALDYLNMYYNETSRLAQLKDFVAVIDHFFS